MHKLQKSIPALIVLLSALLAGRLRAQTALDLEQLKFEPIIAGLDRPVGITHAGDGSGRLFITLQTGRIVIFDGERLLETPFLDITSQVASVIEQGLLSVAFHPNFQSNGFLFVDYTDVSGNTVVSRFKVSDDPSVADSGSELILLRIVQPGSNHNGGQLQFGPDGMLFIGLGDGGEPGIGHREAQRLESLFGAILRIDVDSEEPYSIPATNPFVGLPDSRWEIWTYGLRNPWRFSFDRLTGDLFIGDVGGQRMEEIDFQPAGSRGGENYGWSSMEGSICFEPGSDCEDPDFTMPIIEYPHREEGCGGCVIGGYRYRGFEFPQLNGVYFYADHCTGKVYGAAENNGVWVTLGARETGLYISTFGEDEKGELYFAEHENGTVYRITSDVPLPRLSLVSPASAIAGGPDLTLTLVGSNFVPGSEVHWNGGPRPAAFVDSTRLQVALSGADIAPEGVGRISVVNPAPGGGSTGVLDFPILSQPILSPAIGAGGVVEAAGYNPGLGVSPGSIASVYGTDLTAAQESAVVDPLPFTLAGSTLRFNGSLAAPLFYASSRQQNIQIPWELEGLEQATLTDIVGSVASPPVMVTLAKYSPGIFSLDATGGGYGAILIAGPEVIIAAPVGAFENSRPVHPGEFLAIFCTGLGPVTNTPPTGMVSPARPLSETAALPTVTIGATNAHVSFSGLTPGAVSLYQVNVEVPDGVQAGDAIPVTLTIGGMVSNTVTVAVEQN